ncbi:hypothetical protein F0249_03300 [Vibrio sp. 03-59-1]|uniref:hypothetical protein n=1 Tax=Vibrio sp. 03-59-1 TaxID=2607607 RepID=UPI00149367AE|nr:hypothetical protein [Vibrio sp. 03-59-1]NOH82824.1 hypothetical protein [Vibrio sp. 03-59-1]
MSVAIQTLENPCHQPCPDMASYSLTREQKERGLTFLQRTRKELRDRQLASLRETRAKLQAQERNSDSITEQIRLSKQIRKIELEANSVIERWS